MPKSPTTMWGPPCLGPLCRWPARWTRARTMISQRNAQGGQTGDQEHLPHRKGSRSRGVSPAPTRRRPQGEDSGVVRRDLRQPAQVPGPSTALPHPAEVPGQFQSRDRRQPSEVTGPSTAFPRHDRDSLQTLRHGKG